ncbi:MAG: acetylornithine deacetylase [Gammaproteobacteria bacterium]|nr:acetylornithine deacetylase [Gammaproteobacteria bacterium]NIR82969.1 acetylornithine deacetylase [Gammaproteobacteria bacterium]NIR90334.1 acetylornithine deacetylase [Gammaproteobacteria bacterium]NIU04115.1 acetylornithine deacetylase [Gammaproteobacteria bacterium]NIV51411.1 acetylornithine deacetylase [Gammaproteobacteria bacterium]
MANGTYTPADLLRTLVSFDTISEYSNLELIRFVETYLRRHGIDSLLTFNEDDTKANLFATIGPHSGAAGVVLSGHTDVVPVDGQQWSTNPFEVVQRNGRLYGRGTADMKGFIACVLALVPEFVRTDLRSPIHIALTYEEENTCHGAVQLVETLKTMGFQPEAVIIGEPTDMQIVSAHKGHHAFETSVVGQEAHASLTHRGVNAIAIAARLIEFLCDLGEELKAHTRPLPGLEPPYTTINVGTIEGGTGFNIVPSVCRFRWEVRPIPGQDVNEVRQRFNAFAQTLLPDARSVASHAAIETRQTMAVGTFEPHDDSPAERLVMSLARTNQTWAIPFGTEAPYYQAADMPVVVFGPGSVENAHKPDEYITVEQMDACVDFLRRLAGRLSA